MEATDSSDIYISALHYIISQKTFTFWVLKVHPLLPVPCWIVYWWPSNTVLAVCVFI